MCAGKDYKAIASPRLVLGRKDNYITYTLLIKIIQMTKRFAEIKQLLRRQIKRTLLVFKEELSKNRINYSTTLIKV